MSYPHIAIIVPFKELDSQVKECIEHCQKLDYPDYEIMLLPDFPLKQRFEKCRDMATGPVHQAVKRNIAIAQINSDIFASIDADAYPEKGWLKNAAEYLQKDKLIGAIAGPNLVVPGVSLYEQAAVKIVHSKRAGVEAAYYIKPYDTEALEFKEAPSSNLLFRRAVVLGFGGYDVDLPTGEDSKLCFNIRKLGYKIVYSPKVVVYHHRRPLYKAHLKRVLEQAKDKANVIKEDFTKDKLVYFIPTLFFLGILLGPGLIVYKPIFSFVYLLGFGAYLSFIWRDSYHKNNPKLSILVFTGMFLTHLAYGIGFLRGLFRIKR